MSNENKCTCPSGDGSLRWPCPAHQPSLRTSAGAAIAVQPVLVSDLVFGYPRELFRVTPGGDVVVSEGVSTTDAARAFWEAVAQMRPRPDAADLNQPSGNSGQLQGDAESIAGAPIDVTDPWRGLYRPEHLRANGDGDMYHPDLPSWPDDREDALDKLVHAQGFDFQIVTGEFTESAMEDGGELYWEEMRAWNPEAPAGDWRLAWKGDTEDGPYAWFVRPMALRPEPEAAAAPLPFEQMHAQLLGMLGVETHEAAGAKIGHLMGADIAARQPVGQEPVGWEIYNGIGKYVTFAKTAAMRDAHLYRGEGDFLPQWEARPAFAAPPAPAAVSVDAPYSLDADPAGIRARVADCITGTMMVGAQNHTPPPAGHWLEPFWIMARAEANHKRLAAVPMDAMFGRIIEADFSQNTLLLEMEPGYRAFAGRLTLIATHPQPAAAGGDA